MEVTYDLETYEFYVDGARAWGATSALAYAGNYREFADVPTWKRDRGKAVAKAISNWILELDHTVHPNTPLDQFVKYIHKRFLRPIASEFFLPAKIDGYIAYVVIADLLVLDPSNNLLLINVKCGADKPVYGLQLAAEALALHQNGFDVHERMTLSLYNDRAERTYHRRAQDFEDFANVMRKLGPRFPLTRPTEDLQNGAG